jgi:hypothetical protein
MPASAFVALTGQADSLRPPQVQPHANGPSRSMAQGPTNAQHRTHKHSTSADMMDPRLQKPSQVSWSPLSATIPHLILYNVNNIQQMLTYPLQKRKHDKDLPTVPGLEVPRISRPTQMSVSLTSHLPPLLCLPASLLDPTIGRKFTYSAYRRPNATRLYHSKNIRTKTPRRLLPRMGTVRCLRRMVTTTVIAIRPATGIPRRRRLNRLIPPEAR